MNGRLIELDTVLTRTTEHSLSVLEKVAEDCQPWSRQVLKIKSVYHTLNMFSKDLGKEALLGEG